MSTCQYPVAPPVRARLERYADLLVRTGVALQPGQELVISAPVERVDFVRIVAACGYAAGAGHVTVIWSDDELARLEYEHVDLPYFERTPAWKAEQLNSLAESGAAFLRLEGSDPMALAAIDPAKPAAAARSHSRDCRRYRDGLDFGRNAWCIAGVPTAAWASVVFPEAASPQEATARLWQAILTAARAAGDDPTADWRAHDAAFAQAKRFMNGHAFDHLRYRSQNGTDLTIGLNPRHIWEGGSARTVAGVTYFPNMPTEEIFTSPDRMRAEGVVHSALPLVHAGQTLRDFWLRFEGGEVVEFDAAVGRDVLEQIIKTDEGARHLGECALISKNTPIRESGLLFYSTLYDENASCHLALGTGFPECVEGGLEMDDEALLAAGINRSHTHVDFMIGSDDLQVMGIKPDGEEVPVFVDGQWAWE